METAKPLNEQRAEQALARVRDALIGLRYGTVTVVVQVERTDKVRLTRP